MTKITPPKLIVGKNYVEASVVEVPVVPTQIAHPWKAVVRTALQTGLPAVFLAGILAILQNTQQFLTELSPDSPYAIYVGGAVTFVTALSALNARIMANPAVNDLLTRFGLGAEPKNDGTVVALPIKETDSGVG